MPTTDAWGIDDGYWDIAGTWHPTPAETRRAILAAMGVDETQGATHPPAAADVHVIPAGQGAALPERGELTLEDGTCLPVAGNLPVDLPVGYHDYRSASGQRQTRIIVTPGQCHAAPPAAWGWAAQLYAARSRQSWGIGDLADLRRLGQWAGGLGADVLLINPLAAAAPTARQEASPYYPSSRRFLNPLYLCVGEVPGAERVSEQLAPLAAAGRELSARRLIDRDAVWQHKQAALRTIWDAATPPPEFAAYCAEQGADLDDFAAYCALAIHHREQDWRCWPAEQRDPHGPGVREFVAACGREIDFHKWQQWLLARQWQAAAKTFPIVNDMPIGVAPHGADAWVWQDLLAEGCTVGAPPDPFEPNGQNWALPPFVPHKLRAAGYAPIIKTLRAGMQYAAGLRIDHVMGLFRLFWIPAYTSAQFGTYVHYRFDELMAIVAVESQRTGTFVVGEDLGTVEPVVHEQLAKHHILSFRVVCFDTRPEQFPARAMAAVTTHDLPTMAGLWAGPSGPSGADSAAADVPPWPPNADRDKMAQRIREMLGLPGDAPPAAAIEEVYRRLGRSPAMVRLATLDDALAVREPPNMPGTMPPVWPNWSLGLPGGIEALEAAELPARIAAALRR